MSKENKITQDEALAKRMVEYINQEGGTLDDNGMNDGLDLKLAAMLRKEIIDPAVIAGSLKLIKAHRDGLYNSMPVGVDLDAMDLLNIVQAHLQSVDAAIAGLEQSIKPVEVLEKEKTAKPLDRMKAQEAEIVDNGNEQS